VTQFGFNL